MLMDIPTKTRPARAADAPSWAAKKVLQSITVLSTSETRSHFVTMRKDHVKLFGLWTFRSAASLTAVSSVIQNGVGHVHAADAGSITKRITGMQEADDPLSQMNGSGKLV